MKHAPQRELERFLAGHPAVESFDLLLPDINGILRGLLATLPESQAFLAPNANSYRRLSPGSFLTAAPRWGYNHGQVAVRIPPSDAANVRLERAEVLPGYLGEDFCKTCLACRRLEARQYRAEVPDLDDSWYLVGI